MPATRLSVVAIFAHPDDIEFCCAGTLLLLRKAGWDIHYMNVSSGNCGSLSMNADETRAARQSESQRAAKLLEATWHPSISDDLEIVYSIPLLRQLASIIRTVQPRIVLTHSPQDYMIDHENTARLAVTAAFSRGMPNFTTEPQVEPYTGDVTVYHAMPHGLCDPLSRQPVVPDAFVDTTSVHARKREALAAHTSQKEWLDASQGMDSYLLEMDAMSRTVGSMSGKFDHSEGWRRRLHLGFSSQETDPLAEALAQYWLANSAD